MPTITLKLDKKRAARLARWARRRKVTKDEVIRDLIDRAGPIETGADLTRWVRNAEGRGLGLGQRRTINLTGLAHGPRGRGRSRGPSRIERA